VTRVECVVAARVTGVEEGGGAEAGQQGGLLDAGEGCSWFDWGLGVGGLMFGGWGRGFWLQTESETVEGG